METWWTDCTAKISGIWLIMKFISFFLRNAWRPLETFSGLTFIFISLFLIHGAQPLTFDICEAEEWKENNNRREVAEGNTGLEENSMEVGQFYLLTKVHQISSDSHPLKKYISHFPLKGWVVLTNKFWSKLCLLSLLQKLWSPQPKWSCVHLWAEMFDISLKHYK